MSLIATKTNISKSGNIGAQLGIVTKIATAESVALVDTTRSGLQMSQVPCLVLGQHSPTPLLSPGTGGGVVVVVCAVSSSWAVVYASGITQPLLFPLIAPGSFCE